MLSKERFAELVRFFDGGARYILSVHVLGGLLWVGVGVLLIYLGVSGVVMSHRFDKAREMTGRVVSIRKADTLLRKLDVTVSWSEGGLDRQTVLRVPPGIDAVVRRKGKELATKPAELQGGDSVRFLLRNEDQSAILPSQRKSVGGLAFDLVAGVIFCLFGAGLVEAGQHHPWGSLWPERLLQRVIERVTGVSFPAEHPVVVRSEAPPVPSPRPSPPPAEKFTITAREKNGITVLNLTGALGSDNWEILDRQLTELLKAGRKSILLNLAHLTRIGSLGEGMLLHFVDTARAAGGEIKFARLTEQARFPSGLMRIADAVEIYSEENEAVASFQRRPTHSAKRIIDLETETKQILKTERGPIIQVSFSGEYPPGSDGAHVAGAMRFFVAKAVREFHPAGVIFDLSYLRYAGGVAICEIIMPLLRKEKGQAIVPNCVVAQGATAKALAPLMAPKFFFGIVGSQLFADVKQALEHLAKQSGLQPIE